MSEEYTFLTEQKKQRPLNKRKLARKTIINIVMAMIFGVTMAGAYTIGMHHANDVIYPTQAEQVTIEKSEMDGENGGPEEVILSDEELLGADINTGEQTGPKADAGQDAADDELLEDKSVVVQNIVQRAELSLTDYEHLYDSLYHVAKDANKSLVQVTGVRSEIDWFSDDYEDNRRGSGILIANNNKELLILVDSTIIVGTQSIQVKFPNGTVGNAYLKQKDPNLDLSIIAIDLAELPENALNDCEMATLGISVGFALLGHPIIAVGSPMGTENSVAYGTVTSAASLMPLVDTDVHIITTDIYGSDHGSGILVNLKGEVIGIITQDYQDTTAENLIKAYGISDIKNSIERMSNGQKSAMFGIYGTDVTDEAINNLGVPKGAYVTEIEMDSPAMECGIQSGDVITMFDREEVRTFTEYRQLLLKHSPGDEIQVKVKRYALGEYTEKTFDVTLGSLE